MPPRMPTSLDIEAIEDDYRGALLVAQEDARMPGEHIDITRKRVTEAFNAIFYNPEGFRPFRGRCRKNMDDTEKDVILTLFGLTRVIQSEQIARYG